MKKTTLAVPSGSSRALAFVAEARVSGRATAELSVVESSGAKAGEGAIGWNPLSFASARAALIEAETELDGRIDELVIFADPPATPGSIAESSPKDIERAASVWAAGHAELLREAARRFEERGGGTIILVVVQAERGPLGSMAAGALLGLAEGMLSSPQGAVRFVAVKDESESPDLLARHIVKLLTESPRETGKLQRFGGRSGIFGRT